MKLTLFATATAAVALLGGAAFAQDQQPPATPTPGSVTAPSTSADTSAAPPADTSSTSATTAAPPADTSSTSTTSDTTASTDVTAPAAASATSYAQGASVTTMTVTNGPVPDTAENRAKYGKPMSRAGQRTAARGN